MTFYEYRKMYKKSVDKIMPLIYYAPRWAETLLDEIPKHGRPPLRTLDDGFGLLCISSWLEWFIFPEYFFVRNATVLFGGLPGLV
jgi:hypothetical protein